ncbi:aspartic proteinase nepenthesin-1-like [Zingiber officinale]|uniref:Peptidase A1 domain-containing protein n=1 Tax=Zingiber officinale TaxID=94328 RepID=A0A8J5I6G8_ZINOF|nr:aspartic proteinase nepenthesin-1-like [Zingiber officinale]KAG6537009.1 hypothetical protein ZIOFF_002087 [Zingiber officinale]
MAKLLPLLLLLLISFAAAPSCSGKGIPKVLWNAIKPIGRAISEIWKDDHRGPGSNVQSTDVLQTQLYASGGSFLMELAIGTPAIQYLPIMDTSSDLIWTQCRPCLQCFSQPTPLYYPSQSSTYVPLPCSNASDCSYSYTYSDSSFTQGALGIETFTFGSAAVSGVAFGCGNNNSGDFANSSGIVGMGRGSWSLVSQLGYGNFSYCLTYDDPDTSRLLLGTMSTLSAQAQSTPFVTNPSLYFPSSYYLSLLGITVGETMLPIPSTTFSIAADGTGGLIIDSVATVTMLVDPAYAELKRAFESQMNLSAADGSAYGLDICFTYGGEDVQVPRLVFHFEGADMDLPPENYIAEDSSVGLLCVAVVRSDFNLSILGNFMQQNMHVRYDLVGERLSFEAAPCDQLM